MDADVPDVAGLHKPQGLVGRSFKIQRCAPRSSPCTIAPMAGCSPTLVEMAFAGHCGLTLEVPKGEALLLPFLFNEELGVVLQIESCKPQSVGRKRRCMLAACAWLDLGAPQPDQQVQIFQDSRPGRVLCARRARPAAGRRSAINCRAFAIILSVLRRRSRRWRMTARPWAEHDGCLLAWRRRC